MDPLRIVVRVLFAWIFAYVLARIGGSRSLKEIDVPSFIVALIIGDMFDDVFWGEVPASQFAVAVATLFLVQLRASLQVFHSGARMWRREG